MAPDAAGTMRKIPEDARIEPGWALARFGDGGWWPAVERGLRDGAFDDEVVAGLADLLRGAGVRAAWITTVPSRPLGRRARPAGRAPGGRARRSRTWSSSRAREQRPPQREMANAVQQAANVRGAFRVSARRPPGTGVLLDDRRSSGWTLAMVGGQLRRAGAERVVPLALGTLT